MNIFLIGSGNIATQLGSIFKKKGHKIVFVYSPTLSHAARLGKELKCKYGNDNKSIVNHPADVYLIAVKDDAIKAVVNKMPALKDQLVVHTSGATDIDVLKKKFKNCGALWQVQTISLLKNTKPIPVPVVIEASNKEAEKKLKQLAAAISNKIYSLNSKQRRVLHLGAVFVNNFPNHLYTIAQSLLQKHKLPYEIFHPLILTTAQNGILNPALAQTGPAKRNDKVTMNAHKKLLRKGNHLAIYKALSKSITELY